MINVHSFDDSLITLIPSSYIELLIWHTPCFLGCVKISNIIIFTLFISCSGFATEDITIPKSIFKVDFFAGRNRTSNGTAFLVGPNLVMTSYHLIRELPLDADLEITKVNADQSETRLKGTPKLCNADLDFCLVMTENIFDGIPLLLSKDKIVPTDLLKLIGFTTTQKISTSSGKMAGNSPSSILLHCIPEESGSSGAPIFNSKNEVVAINFAKMAYESGCSTREEVGVASYMSQILIVIKYNNPALYQQLKIVD